MLLTSCLKNLHLMNHPSDIPRSDPPFVIFERKNSSEEIFLVPSYEERPDVAVLPTFTQELYKLEEESLLNFDDVYGLLASRNSNISFEYVRGLQISLLILSEFEQNYQL